MRVPRAPQEAGAAAYFDIDVLGLVLAAGFVVFVAVVAHGMRLGMMRTILVAAARTYVQLSLLGWVLLYLFASDHPAITGAVFGLMILLAAHTIVQRLKEVPVPVFAPVLAAVASGGIAVTFVVVAVLIGAAPFWTARVWLPMGGMVLGNSMTGIAIAVERLFSDLQLRKAEVRALLALGATPAEAREPSLRTALRAGFTPIINNMAAVGLVMIPGMMAGQVLAGADPQQAARYQIVVMLMIAGSTALGSISAVVLCARKTFDDDGIPARWLQA